MNVIYTTNAIYNSQPSRVAKVQAKQASHCQAATRPQRAQAQAKWITELAACYTRTYSYSLELHCTNNNTRTSLQAICPFTGIAHTIDCSHMPMTGSLPRQAIVAMHPLLSCYLPTHTEDSLSLQWQVLRSLYILASKGLVHMSAPFILPTKLAGSSLHRLLIAQDKLLELAYMDSASYAKVPQYNHQADCSIDTLCVWAVVAHSAATTGSTSNTGIDDIDSMLTASERQQQLEAKKAEASTKAARVAAQRKLAVITLKDAISTVCDIMEDLPHSGWIQGVHSTRLQAITKAAHNLDLGWIDIMQELIQESYPDATFVGNNAYSCMIVVSQKLDAIAMQAIQATQELGYELEGEAQLVHEKIKARYSVQGIEATTSTGSTLDFTVQAVSNSKPALDNALRLAKQLKAVEVLSSSAAPVASISLAERLAALKASKR